MENFLVEETPGKVMGLLGAALFSVAFLFAVSASNASFESNQFALPDPFAPGKVVSAIDHMAASYSKMLTNFAQPMQESFAVHVDQAKWILNEASTPLVRTLGLEGSISSGSVAEPQAQVAGAFKIAGNYESISVDTLYNLLLSNW
jgi:hypothetical protein